MNNTKKKRTLALYVWEGVLQDYTSGIAFALAYSAKDARKMLQKSVPSAAREFNSSPLRVTSPKAFYLYGGG